MADNYGLQRWIQSRDQFQALAEREGILPNGLARPEGVPNPNDFTDRYNTQLSPREEALFQDWLKQSGRSVDELYDYDLRGAWKSGDVFKLDGRGHLPDTYKKPNHPTFSNESQYSGQDGFVGGHWSELPNGRFVFRPGSTNTFDKQVLNSYMLRNEAPNYGTGFSGVTLLDSRPGSYYNEDIGDTPIHLDSGSSGGGFTNFITSKARQLSNPLTKDWPNTIPRAHLGTRG